MLELTTTEWLTLAGVVVAVIGPKWMVGGIVFEMWLGAL